MSDDLSTLADALLAARAAKAEADDAAKVASAAVKDAERALFDAMVGAELTKISAAGHSFSLDSKTYYSCTDKDALHEVLGRHGCGGIFRYTVHAGTLNATLREMADAEGRLPEDVAALVDAYDEGKVSVRKAPAGR